VLLRDSQVLVRHLRRQILSELTDGVPTEYLLRVTRPMSQESRQSSKSTCLDAMSSMISPSWLALQEALADLCLRSAPRRFKWIEDIREWRREQVDVVI